MIGGPLQTEMLSAQTWMSSRRPWGVRRLKERICPVTRRKSPPKGSQRSSTASGASTGSTSRFPESRSTSREKAKNRVPWLSWESRGAAARVPQRVI